MDNMKEEWKTIGYVGVDSGSLMIGDPCYLDDDTYWNPELYDKWICGRLCEDGVKSVEIDELCMHQAVAFESGYGDGVYEVKALIKDCGDFGKRIKEVRVILIED